VLKPFTSPGYAWLWCSNAFSASGRWALVLILSLQLLQTTHSSFWVGLGLFLTQGPVILLAPVSGILADRFDRRTLNVMSSAAAGVTTGLLALTTWLGVLTLPLELALSLAYGVTFVFQLTLRSTLVPSIVPPAQLVSAVSLFQVGTQGAQFLGPALATPALVSGGPVLAWLFCTGLYAASALTSIPVRTTRTPSSIGNPTGVLQESFRYLYARPLVWTAIWAVSLHCALTMAYQGMLPMFVNMDLRAPASSYGALLTSIGLGAAMGSLGLARLSAVRFRPALFGISLVGSGISLAVMAATSSVTVSIASGFFVGATQAVFMSMALALIQGSVDDEFRGRATSFYQMITMAPMAIFGWGMGGLADITEPRPLMIVSGIGFVVVMVILLFTSSWLRALFGVRAWVSGSQPATVPALT
jgi:predicted MFS family arabinose efflux permease